jgi:hypothetical protein
MRLRPRAYGLLLAATLLATSGCFCCRPWHHCHRCCYAGPDAVAVPPPCPPAGGTVR